MRDDKWTERFGPVATRLDEPEIELNSLEPLLEGDVVAGGQPDLSDPRSFSSLELLYRETSMDGEPQWRGDGRYAPPPSASWDGRPTPTDAYEQVDSGEVDTLERLNDPLGAGPTSSPFPLTRAATSEPPAAPSIGPRAPPSIAPVVMPAEPTGDTDAADQPPAGSHRRWTLVVGLVVALAAGLDAVVLLAPTTAAPSPPTARGRLTSTLVEASLAANARNAAAPPFDPHAAQGAFGAPGAATQCTTASTPLTPLAAVDSAPGGRRKAGGATSRTSAGSQRGSCVAPVARR